MSILPEGEQLRKAVRWISERRTDMSAAELSRLVGDACLKFDLSPKDTDLLMRFFAEKE